MKFTDGNWLIRPGVAPFHPAQAYEVHADQSSVTVVAVTRKIAHRGDTLDGPLLTVRFSSPIEDVIGVRLTHWTGAQDPGLQFDLADLPPPPVAIDAAEHDAALTSGKLTAHVGGESEWGIRFTTPGDDGAERIVTSSGFRAMGLMQVEGQGTFLHEQLDLGVGELVYGLGERFTAFVKNGQVVDVWNRDGGTSSEQAYKNIPFYMTNKGYGVFVNHPGAVSFEVASEKVARVQFSVPGESLEYYVIYGPTPKEVLEKYTRLTGRPALPPAWSFGLWLSTSFTTNYDEATITSFIDGMAERDLPLHVFHFDCFWMREFRWCDFEWDTRVFPDPPAMLRRLKERGLHISVWINPYVGQLSPLFEEGKTHGYLLTKPNGDVWQTEHWQAGMGMVDFTNPDACAWYAGKLRALLHMGVDCLKTDFGERIPTDVVYHDRADPERMHNYYTYLYNKTVFELLEQERGQGEAVLFARSATAGGQKFPVHWGGDCHSTFEAMAESLRGGLSLGLSGFGFWSHDIGGFEGKPPEELYKRWVAFGLLSSHSRLHGSASYRVPWQYEGTGASDTLRHFTKLKCRLMPYLFSQAVAARALGTPMLRAMLLEFPDDPACATLDRQYMLGENLLVAPVFASDNSVEYYVPAGTWTHVLSGETITGPVWRRETHDFLSLPLLARPNSIIAFGASDIRPDYDYADGATLRVYHLEDNQSASAIIPTTRGETALRVTVARSGDSYQVTAEGEAGNWRLLIVGIQRGSVSGGYSTEQTDEGLIIRPTA